MVIFKENKKCSFEIPLNGLKLYLVYFMELKNDPKKRLVTCNTRFRVVILAAIRIYNYHTDIQHMLNTKILILHAESLYSSYSILCSQILFSYCIIHSWIFLLNLFFVSMFYSCIFLPSWKKPYFSDAVFIFSVIILQHLYLKKKKNPNFFTQV